MCSANGCAATSPSPNSYAGLVGSPAAHCCTGTGRDRTIATASVFTHSILVRGHLIARSMDERSQVAIAILV